MDALECFKSGGEFFRKIGNLENVSHH
jgi:hypothetical protein